METSKTKALPSRTSILVAAARAFGARDPDEGVRNPDYLAEKLIGPEELELIGDQPVGRGLKMDYAEAIEEPGIAFMAGMMVLRTRFIDEALGRAVANGAKQVVILGAGFDSRAYRFRELLEDCHVIEADIPATQEYKKRRLRDAGIEIPANVRYVATNFAEDGIVDALKAGGFEEGKPTFYIWEGVAMYLSEENVRAMLRMIAVHSAPGSSVALDYTNGLGLRAMQTFPGMGSFAEWGEPWRFGVPGNDGREFFREMGFDPGMPISLSDPDAMKRYAVRSDGTSYADRAAEKMRMQQMQPGNQPPEGMRELHEAIVAAGGVYWLAELKV